MVKAVDVAVEPRPRIETPTLEVSLRAERRRRHTWLFAGLVVMAVLVHIPALSNRPYNSDEAYLATQAQVLNRGGHLYIDTVDRKPPIVPFVYALAFRVTHSDELFSVRLLAVLVIAATGLLLALEAEARFGGARAGVIAGGLFVASTAAFFPKDGQTANFEMFMLLPMVASVMLARRARPFASGVAISIATLTKQTAASTLLALAWIVWHQRRYKAPSNRLRQLGRLGLGFVVPLALAALIFNTRAFVHWVFTSNDAYLDVTGVLGYALKLGASETTYFLLGNGVLVLLAAFAWRSRSEDADLWIWALSGVLAIAAGVRFFGHYYLQLLPPLCLLATRPLVRRPKWLLGLVGAVVLVSVACFNAGELQERKTGTERTAEDLAKYARAHTDSSSPILVWGHLPEAYWESDRPPASRFETTGFLTGLSGGRPLDHVGIRYATPQAWEDFMFDLNRHPPALVFDLAPANVRNAKHAPPWAFPQFLSFLHQHYRPVDVVDSVVVYTRVA